MLLSKRMLQKYTRPMVKIEEIQKKCFILDCAGDDCYVNVTIVD